MYTSTAFCRTARWSSRLRPGVSSRSATLLSLFSADEFDPLRLRAGFARIDELGPRELVQSYPDARLTGIERLAALCV